MTKLAYFYPGISALIEERQLQPLAERIASLTEQGATTWNRFVTPELLRN
jgi:hypothetical protein